MLLARNGVGAGARGCLPTRACGSKPKLCFKCPLHSLLHCAPNICRYGNLARSNNTILAPLNNHHAAGGSTANAPRCPSTLTSNSNKTRYLDKRVQLHAGACRTPRQGPNAQTQSHEARHWSQDARPCEWPTGPTPTVCVLAEYNRRIAEMLHASADSNKS